MMEEQRRTVSEAEWLEFQSWLRRGKPQLGHAQNVTIKITAPPEPGQPPGSGRVLHVQRSKNLVVDTGLEASADMWARAAYGPDTMAVGTGSAAVVAGDTSLNTEVYSAAIDRRIRTTKKITFEMILTTADGNGHTLAEEGVKTGSVLLLRSLISPTVAKTAAFEVTISHELTLAST